MSVIVIARFPVADVARARASLTENGALLKRSPDAKKLGAIHHLFAAGEREMIVIDEWDKGESSKGFSTATRRSKRSRPI